jgi:hypothetical protein
MKRQNSFKTNPVMPIVEPKTRPMPTREPVRVAAKPSPKIQGKNNLLSLIKQHEKIAFAFLVIGICLGLIWGWVIDPVEWTGMSYTELTPEDKGLLIQLASDLSAYDPGNPAVIELNNRWGELDQLACFVANNQVADESERIRLVSLAYKVNQRGCE